MGIFAGQNQNIFMAGPIPNTAASTPVSPVRIEVDFKALLGKLYNKATDFVWRLASPDVKEITIEGIGTFANKNDPGVQAAGAFHLSTLELQLSSCTSYLEYIFKTAPQILERAI